MTYLHIRNVVLVVLKKIYSIYSENTECGEITRTHWVIDKDIPMFKSEGREYIDKLVYVGE